MNRNTLAFFSNLTRRINSCLCKIAITHHTSDTSATNLIGNAPGSCYLLPFFIRARSLAFRLQ